MVKKYIIIILMAFVAKTGSSQVLIAILFGDKLNSDKLQFGLMVSPALSNITNIESAYKPGLGIGLYFNIKLNDRFWLHPEAIPKLAFGAKDIPVYATGNTTLDSLYEDGNVKRSVKAIGLPLLVRYRISDFLFAEAGPQIDLLTKSKDIFKTKVEGDELSYDKKTKGVYTRFDVGYAVGFACKIKPGPKGMTLGIRYYGGLTDVMKNTGGKQANSAWFLNFYIPVSAGKAATN